MASLKLIELARAASGRLIAGDENHIVRSISIDSRTVKTGDLFFALRGPRFDGHDFLKEVFDKGACGAMISEEKPDYTNYQGKALILVHDTADALRRVGAWARQVWNRTLVGITGSTGKTSTKDFTAEVLQGKYRVLKSPGNLNNLYGLPLSLYNLDETYDVAVFELAMSRHGEIAELCEIARPNVGVYTNVSPVHLEFFSSVDDIAEAKAELAEHLDPGGALIFNADDPRVRRIADRFSGKRISYGIDSDADVQAKEVMPDGLKGTRFRIVHGENAHPAFIPLVGIHNVYNALAATATAFYFNMSAPEVVQRLQNIHPSSMRGEFLAFAEGFTVINDSYNSNPKSLEQMVRTVSAMAGFRRKIIVAGEMLELGRESGRFHMECGRLIARSRIDVLICIQGDAKRLAEGAIESGLSAANVHYFASAAEAGPFLCQQLRPGDLVLVKGSRGVRTEQVISMLKKKFKLKGE
jgi:UDP-N-acetylmuramoyl-tripeptide--D-alanyl-D-alanine ligase